MSGDVSRTVSVVETDPSPIQGSSFAVTLAPDAMTNEHPASVTITFRNEGEQRLFGFGRPAPFATRKSERNGAWTLLNRDSLGEDEQPTPVSENCWKPDYDDPSAYEQLQILDYHELERCESISTTYELWSHYKNESCMPVGEYEFSDTIHLKEDSNEEATEFRWGFTLSVDKP